MQAVTPRPKEGRQVRQTPVARKFTAFYEETWRPLSAYATALTQDANVGADLAQEAFARVYTRWPVLRDARPYSFRVVTNLARDFWRRSARERETLALIDIGQPAIANESELEILDAIRRLPKVQREVVLLHYYADLTVNEIASVLRRPAGTVKSRLFDARQALAKSLKEPR